MQRLIDANEALRLIDNSKDGSMFDGVIVAENVWKKAHNIARACVEACPTIEAEPVLHGRWVDFDYDIGGYRNIGEKCSLCGFETHQTKGSEYNYCPNCGAKMDVTDINVGNKDGGAEQ